MKGLSITFVFGKFAKPHIGIKTQDVVRFRLCLGWFALTIYFCDIEKLMEYWVNENKKLSSEKSDE